MNPISDHHIFIDCELFDESHGRQIYHSTLNVEDDLNIYIREAKLGDNHNLSPDNHLGFSSQRFSANSDRDSSSISNDGSVVENDISLSQNENLSLEVGNITERMDQIDSIDAPAGGNFAENEERQSISYEDENQQLFNQFDHVQEISETKMENLRCYLVLSMSGHVIGFLIQAHFIPYLIIFSIIFLGLLAMLFKVITKSEDFDATFYNGKSKFFRAMNWACLSLYSLIVILRCLNKIEGLSQWAIPGCMSIFIEPFFSYFTSHEKGVEKSLKYALWVQILLLSLKLDGASIPWSFAMLIFISFAFISIIIALILLAIFICTFFGMCCYDISGKVAILGSGWYFLISLSNVIWGAVIVHIENKLTGENDQISLHNIFIVGACYSLFLIIFTLLFQNVLILFLKYEALHDLQNTREPHTGDPNVIASSEEPPRHRYLAKVTGTYFSTIQTNLKIKDKEALNKWNKEMKRAKFYKFLPCLRAKILPKSTTASPTLIPIKKKRSQSLNSFMQNAKLPIQASKSIINGEQEELYSPCMELKQHRIVYSFDDKEVVKKVKRPNDEENTEEKDTCFICYEANANAVIMDCGHGGICYSCAIKSWERSDRCHMCRGDIKSILKVKALPEKKLVKVLDEIEKIKQEEEEDIITSP